MCRMTELGARWKRSIELPPFGETTLWWAVRYGDEIRYIREPSAVFAKETRLLMRPLYAVRVTARAI